MYELNLLISKPMIATFSVAMVAIIVLILILHYNYKFIKKELNKYIYRARNGYNSTVTAFNSELRLAIKILKLLNTEDLSKIPGGILNKFKIDYLTELGLYSSFTDPLHIQSEINDDDINASHKLADRCRKVDSLEYSYRRLKSLNDKFMYVHHYFYPNMTI